MSKHQIVRAATMMPDGQIIRYSYPENKMTVLWESGAALLRRQTYPAVKVRARDDILFEDEEAGIIITGDDVDRSIATAKKKTPEFATLLDPDPYEEAEDADAS